MSVNIPASWLWLWLFSCTSVYHSTDLLTARGVAHLVVHGTTGSTSYETIPPFVRLETSGGRKVKPIWILLKQETVSGSGISWAICKSAPRSRQITMPAPHHSVFYGPHALPADQREGHRAGKKNYKLKIYWNVLEIFWKIV